MKKKGRGSNLVFIEAALYTQVGKKPFRLDKRIMEFTEMYTELYFIKRPKLHGMKLS